MDNELFWVVLALTAALIGVAVCRWIERKVFGRDPLVDFEAMSDEDKLDTIGW